MANNIKIKWHIRRFEKGLFKGIRTQNDKKLLNKIMNRIKR